MTEPYAVTLPSTDADKPAGRRRFYLRWWFLLPASLLCLVAIVWGAGYTYVLRDAAVHRELIERVDALWNAGEPVDNESLDVLYQSANSDSYTDDWVALGEQVTEGELHYKISELFQSPDDPTVEIIYPVPPPETPWNDRQRVDQLLSEWNDELTTLLRLLELQQEEDMPLYRPIHFDSLNTLVPESQNAKDFAQLLKLRHRVAVYDHEDQLAFELIRAGQALEQTFYADPILVNQLVRIAISSATCGMIRVSLQEDRLTDEQMKKITDDLISFERSNELYRQSMRGERAIALPVFTDPRISAESLELEPKLGESNVLMRGDDGMYFLDAMQAAIDLPATDMRGFCEAAKALDDRISKDANEHGMYWNFKHMLTQLLLPAFQAYARATVRQVELNRLTQLAMSVRRFEHQFGRWPESLDELNAIHVDAQSLRAANEQAFGYRIEENGEAVLWGIHDSLASPIPDEPPPTDGVQNEDNLEWVWRLRPSATSSASVPLP